MKIEELISKKFTDISKDKDLLNLLYSKLGLTTGEVEKFIEEKDKKTILLRAETEEGLKIFEIGMETVRIRKSVIVVDRTFEDVLRVKYTISNDRKVYIEKIGRYDYGIRVDDIEEVWNREFDKVNVINSVRTYSKKYAETRFKQSYSRIDMSEKLMNELLKIKTTDSNSFFVKFEYLKDFNTNQISVRSITDSYKTRKDCSDINSSIRRLRITTFDGLVNLMIGEGHYLHKLNVGQLEDTKRVQLDKKVIKISGDLIDSFPKYFSGKENYAMPFVRLIENNFEIVKYEFENRHNIGVFTVRKDGETRRFGVLLKDGVELVLVELTKNRDNEFHLYLYETKGTRALIENITDRCEVGLVRYSAGYNVDLVPYYRMKMCYDSETLEMKTARTYENILEEKSIYCIGDALKGKDCDPYHKIVVKDGKVTELTAFGIVKTDLSKINDSVGDLTNLKIDEVIRRLKTDKVLSVNAFIFGPKCGTAVPKPDMNFGKNITRSRRKK